MHSFSSPTFFKDASSQHIPLSTNSEVQPSLQLMEETQATSMVNYYSPCMQFTDEVNEQAWEQLQDLFFRLQPSTTTNDKTVDNAEDTKRASDNELKTEDARKTTSTKDRHSKINTAHGLRDRRMRLSIDVARKFFDLQDLLGYDKASKTVEWLLMKSNSAIVEIKGRLKHNCNNVIANSISSASECEVIIPENENQKTIKSKKVKMKSHFKKGKKDKVARRVALHQFALESRKNARERARRRTLEKKKIGEANVSIGEMDCESWSHFEKGGKWSNAKIDPTFEQLKAVEEFRAQNQHLLGISGNWNPSAFCFSQNDGDISPQETEPIGGLPF